MKSDLLSNLPIKDQEKYELAMARKQVLESVKPDLNGLSRSVRENIESQIELLPQEDTTRILKLLQESPASQIIAAIRDGAFSETEQVSEKKSGFSIGGAIASLVSKILQPAEQIEVSRKTKKGFVGEVRANGPKHRSPSFSAEAEASESKASAYSHNDDGQSGVMTDQSSGRAIVRGIGTAASSTTTVKGKVTFEGSQTDYGSIKIKNK